MSQRTKVTGTRSCTIWLLALIAIVLIIGVAAGGPFFWFQLQQQQATQARQAKIEQHYQAGVAFQNVGDWGNAAQEYEQVIALDANYKDTQTRLTQVKGSLMDSAATATAVALAQAERIEAEAKATAAAASTATAVAQANVQATAAAAPAATTAALEAHYQKGLGYMNIGRWEEAKAEMEEVFKVDPNYKDVQAKLAEIETILPTLTPLPTAIPTFTPFPTPILCTQFEEAQIKKVIASGVWDERYMPEKAVDGDLRTGWWAGQDQKEGAWIGLELDSEYLVAKLEILNGFPDYWDGNPRVKDFTLIFSDGSKQTRSLYDNVKALQEVDLEPTLTNSLRFVVDEVYRSKDFQAPGFNEIKVYHCKG